MQKRERKLYRGGQELATPPPGTKDDRSTCKAARVTSLIGLVWLWEEPPVEKTCVGAERGFSNLPSYSSGQSASTFRYPSLLPFFYILRGGEGEGLQKTFPFSI